MSRPSESDGHHFPLKGKGHRWQHGGDLFIATAPGGGGWGDPFTREPAAVLEDVLEGLVTLEAARRDYGVALAADLTSIDEEQTVSLRAAGRTGGT